MRAKFINEKFKEDSDPIKDLNMGEPFVQKTFEISKDCAK
jgi:hypothetical protein